MSAWKEANEEYTAALERANEEYMANKDSDLRGATIVRRMAQREALRRFDERAARIRRGEK